ncbi:Spc98 family-domain-containing protein [Phlebopus sp. FC_14]|nr:Spc98 family-domain-containing protein [Phlebopus sp. FC_14]
MNTPSSGSSALPTRPHSRVTQRPSSSLSHRPPSSLSSARPLSSASFRPQSRVSRPSSRPQTRQSIRLLPLCQNLVTQTTGLSPENDEDNFRTAVDFVSKNLEHATKAGPSIDVNVMERQLRGYHVEKARVNCHDNLADALEKAYRKVKDRAKELTGLDDEIKLSRLPDHLQLLMLLSSPPARSTVAFAVAYEDAQSSKPPTMTWNAILAEEPFEGQHWEGAYGLPPGSTVEGWETRSDGSTPSLSPWDESDSLDENASRSSLDGPPSPVPVPLAADKARPSHSAPSHRMDVEELKSRQYWRDDWQVDVDVSRPFDLGDPSTLGKYILERDALREVLTCLQGRNNIMIYTTPDTFSSPSPAAPRLLHLTLTAQSSILTSFAHVTTTICHLRKFVSAIFQKVVSPQESPSSTTHLLTHCIRSRTIEAFADAIDTQIQQFDRWCAGKEEAICRATAGTGDPLVVSLLSLDKDVRDTFAGTFDALLSLLHRVVEYICQSHDRLDQAVWNMANMPSRVPMAAVSALLLELLLEMAEEQSSMGNTETSRALTAVFAKTIEPIWEMIGKWLKDGMPVRNAWDGADARSLLDEEFFIEDNELRVMDPDFWAQGYVLRKGVLLEKDDKYQSAVPSFLGPVVDRILGAGKAVGLLRTMGIHFFGEYSEQGRPEGLAWRSFTKLVASNLTIGRDSESLSHLISEEVSPYCLAAGLRLSRVLTEECDLSRHIVAIEGLYLMTRGDVISNFTDVLFAKMNSRQSWNDFHFLNSAFSDVIAASNATWIETSLVRLSYRGTNAASISKTVKAIHGLLMEYAAPFPLTYIFTPTVLQSYGSIFVFLLQIRRAKSVLERILLRGAVANVGRRNELKVLYTMRGKLSWFINAFFNFLTTHVIHSQVIKFKRAFQGAKSLDEMIQIHNEHLERLTNQCFLDSATSPISKAVLSVLDMCLHFRTFFTTFAGDTAHDISQLSISIKRHKSRRLRRQRKNIIGFSLPKQKRHDDSEDSEEDSESDVDEEDDDETGLNDAPEPSFSVMEPSYMEQDVSTQLQKLSGELDGLVRYVRRGAESLAGGTLDAASAFGALAFTLEDWDL